MLFFPVSQLREVKVNNFSGMSTVQRNLVISNIRFLISYFTGLFCLVSVELLSVNAGKSFCNVSAEFRSANITSIKMIKALKDASLFPCVVNLPVSHAGDIWSICPDCSIVHVFAALRNTRSIPLFGQLLVCVYWC